MQDAKCKMQNEARERFEQLATEYFESCYRASPTSATEWGIHEYDHLLDDFSQGALKRRSAELKAFRRKFNALDKVALQNGAGTDLELISCDIENELWLLQDTRDWETDPSYYVADPFFSIFLIALRNFAPLEERLECVTARLNQVPELLAAARANLKNPPHILTEIGIEETQGALEFCETLLPQLAAQMKITRRLGRAVENARRALRAFLDYLQEDLTLTSTGKLGIGAKHYAKILKYEHMLPYTIAQVVAMGERVFQETERELGAWAKRIDRTKTWREIADEARTQFPPRHRLLSAYRREVAHLREFVSEHDLVTLPAQDCEVVETPPFDRALNSYAAYIAPGPFEPEQRGQ